MLLSWTRWRHNASGYQPVDNLSLVQTRYSAFALLTFQRSMDHAIHRVRFNRLSTGPPSMNALLLDGEEYLCSFSHEDSNPKLALLAKMFNILIFPVYRNQSFFLHRSFSYYWRQTASAMRFFCLHKGL